MTRQKCSCVSYYVLAFCLLMVVGCSATPSVPRMPETLPPFVKEHRHIKLHWRAEMINTGIYLSKGEIFSILSTESVNFGELKARIGEKNNYFFYPFWEPDPVTASTDLAEYPGYLYLRIEGPTYHGLCGVDIIVWKKRDMSRIVDSLEKMKEKDPDNKAIRDAINETKRYRDILAAYRKAQKDAEEKTQKPQELNSEKIIPSEDSRAYANSIVDYGDVYHSHRIHHLLGAAFFPQLYSPACTLGRGWVIVDMGKGEEIIDQDGPDLRVYEHDSHYNPKWIPESYDVFISNDKIAWKHLGLGLGTSSFDLSKVNMREARYVKIKGYSAIDKYKSLKSPGPDIDAIEALHMRGPSVPASAKISKGFKMPTIRQPMVKEYEHITLGRKQHTMLNTGLYLNEGEIYSIVVDDTSLRSYLMVKVGNSNLKFNPPYHAKAPQSGYIYLGVYKDPVSGPARRPIDAHIILWEKEDYSAVADFFEERKRKIPKNKAIVEALDEANRQWGKYLASQKVPEERTTYEDVKIAKGEEKVPKPTESPEQLDEVKKRLEEEKIKAILLGKELEEKEKRERALLSKLDQAPKIAPIIVLVTPKDESRTEIDVIRISGVVEDDKGLERVDIFLNNEQLAGRGLTVIEGKYPKRLEFQEGILLERGENEIKISAVDSDGLSSEKAVKVHCLKKKIDVKNTALLIGISEYEHWNSLMNPTTDIEAIAIELEEYYGFDIRKPRNASKTEILTEIRELAKGSYAEDEQLLIWFSGHGYFDDLSKIGYIVAKDTLSLSADPIFDTFIDYPKLMRIISNIPCRHILLVVDACFAGTLDSRLAMRSTDLYADIPKEEYIQRKLKFKTRLYLTSGGKQYVPDGRPGQHSPFTRKFLAALRSYGGRDGILTFEEIISLYMDKVRPQPRYNEFLGNEPGSSFIFIAK